MGMDEIGLDDLQNCQNLIIVCSTWGDGDQPDNAVDLFEAVERLLTLLRGRHSKKRCSTTSRPGR